MSVMRRLFSLFNVLALLALAAAVGAGAWWLATNKPAAAKAEGRIPPR